MKEGKAHLGIQGDTHEQTETETDPVTITATAAIIFTF